MGEGDAGNEQWVWRIYGGRMTGDGGGGGGGVGAMGCRNGEPVVVAVVRVVWLMSCACLRWEGSRAVLKRGFQNQKL